MRLTIEITSNMTNVRASFLKLMENFLVEMITKDNTEFKAVFIKDVDEKTGTVDLTTMEGHFKQTVRISDIKKIRYY